MLTWSFVFFGLAIVSGIAGATVHDARVFAALQVMFFGSVALFVAFTLLRTVLPHPARGADAFPSLDERLD